jgi:hypothetical protein
MPISSERRLGYSRRRVTGASLFKRRLWSAKIPVGHQNLISYPYSRRKLPADYYFVKKLESADFELATGHVHIRIELMVALVLCRGFSLEAIQKCQQNAPAQKSRWKRGFRSESVSGLGWRHPFDLYVQRGSQSGWGEEEILSGGAYALSLTTLLFEPGGPARSTTAVAPVR